MGHSWTGAVQNHHTELLQEFQWRELCMLLAQHVLHTCDASTTATACMHDIRSTTPSTFVYEYVYVYVCVRACVRSFVRACMRVHLVFFIALLNNS